MGDRPYQTEAVEATVELINNGVPQCLIALPTGSGKTTVSARLAERLGPKWGRLLFLVGRDELVWQTVNQFKARLPTSNVGVEKAEFKCNPQDHGAVVASIQTLSSAGYERLKKFDPENTWLFTDEAHHSTSSTHLQVYDYFKVLPEHNNPTPHCGLTATPKRSDRVGLDKVFRAISYQKNILDLIRTGVEINGKTYGYLADFRAYQVQTSADISSVHTKAGDFDEKELGKAVDIPERNELIVKKYKQLGEGLPGIAFTANIEHTNHLVEEFNRQGIVAMGISGETPMKLRREIIAEYKKRSFPILISCGILNEGFDAEVASVALMARPTKSQLLFVQQIGRVSRPSPSPEEYLRILSEGQTPEWIKPFAVVVDFCDLVGKYNLIRLPSLFGLKASFNLKGKSAIQTVDELEQLEMEFPGFDPGDAEDMAAVRRKLKDHTERIELFGSPVPDVTVQQWSKLGWVKVGEFRYHLGTPSDQSTLISEQNLVGGWDVWKSHHGYRTKIATCDELKRAIQYADSIVPAQDRPLLKAGMAWEQESATTKQVNYLWKLSHACREGFDDPKQLQRHFSKLHRAGDGRFGRKGVSDMIDIARAKRGYI